jgi:hypothetical protein
MSEVQRRPAYGLFSNFSHGIEVIFGSVTQNAWNFFLTLYKVDSEEP